MHRLLTRTTLAIDSHPRHLHRKPRRQPGRACDIARLRPDGIDTPENDVVDTVRVDFGAFEQMSENARPQICRMGGRERAPLFSDCSAHRIDDVCLGHRELLHPGPRGYDFEH